MKNKNMKTLAYAGSKVLLHSLTSQLDHIPELKKVEEGSPKDPDGHVISYFLEKECRQVTMFFAMIHSNGENYLIRADKNLFDEL